MTAINKTMNEYAGAVGGKLYGRTPKAVFAAVAVSMVTNGGDHLNNARRLFLEEWWILHEAGIVPQKPPFRLTPIEGEPEVAYGAS
jgi:hypothetical protein